MNPEPRNKPTVDELDYLLSYGLLWVDGWVFTFANDIYDLSAADIQQIEHILDNGLFKVQS